MMKPTAIGIALIVAQIADPALFTRSNPFTLPPKAA